MTLFQAIFLAIVQGLTEFLPISSSGHLVLFQTVFRFSQPPVFFDVLLHFGTLLAIFIYFKKELMALVKDWENNINLWVFLFVGSLPAAFFGFFLNQKAEKIFASLKLVGLMWIFFGLLLLATKRLEAVRGKQERRLKDVTWSDALIIGLFQAAALFPGISRSGATIIGGMGRKFSRQMTFFLSFWLAIPAILGAMAWQFKEGDLGGISPLFALISTLLAGIFGYFSLKFLAKTLKSDKFYLFGFYCLSLGFLTFFL